jgi:hypothetical protein
MSKWIASCLVFWYFLRREFFSCASLFRPLQMFTDGWFLHGADRAVSLQSQKSPAPVFYYHFAYRGSNSHSRILGHATRNYGKKTMWCISLQQLSKVAAPYVLSWVMNDFIFSTFVQYHTRSAHRVSSFCHSSFGSNFMRLFHWWF